MQTINPIPIHTRLNNCEINVAIAAPFIPIGVNPHFPNISKENVILGIRPEKMVTGGDLKLTVDVEITELLGSEKIAYFNIGDKKCSAKLSADYDIGKTLKLSINPTDIYYFDKETGARL